jgi:hypothetical protein
MASHAAGVDNVGRGEEGVTGLGTVMGFSWAVRCAGKIIGAGPWRGG